MKKLNRKTIGLNLGGFLAYVGFPLVPVGVYWDFFVHKDARTTISAAALLVLICGVSVVKFFFNNRENPIRANNLWIVIFVLSVALKPVVDKLIVVSAFGMGGSVVGSALFAQANKIKKDNERRANNAELVKAIKENGE